VSTEGSRDKTQPVILEQHFKVVGQVGRDQKPAHDGI
jgi:hypothetical protein